MNITVVFRKFLITFCILLLSHFTFYTVAFAQNLNISPQEKDRHPKMSSYLQNLEKKYKEGIGAQQMVTQGLNISAPDPEKVTVYLMSAPDTSLDENAIENLGGQIVKQVDNVAKAKIPIDMLTAVADNVDGVSFMKTPDKLIPVAVSQGVNLTGAVDFQNAGYDGSGVNVAVIDLGFAGISSSELPGVIKIDCTGGSCESSNFNGETDSHGTAVAEIVYDMAPGATLYLIKVTDTMDLEDAKNFAVNNEVRIINMSLVVPNTNFYDGKCWSYDVYLSPVCTADDAYANNILWVNAAGNEAQKHYEAVFSDPDSDGWHNVNGDRETINISAGDGDTIEVYLTWNSWPTTDQDYDLYLYNDSNTLVASSTSSQTGSQPPIENIDYSVPASGGGGTYYLSILKKSASSNHLLEIYSIYHNLSDAVASSSLLGPADAAGAMAVGAINYSNWTTGPQESFSSRGPTNDGRTKPDIMGPDKVYSPFYGSGFAGTSASAPHVAGAAALMLNIFPGINVDQLWNSLTSNAIDMGDPGKDNIYGYGRLNLDINAPVPSITNVTNSGGGGGGGVGCFIATAAYGSYAAPSVLILREMRDRFLLTHSIGKSFVNLYYKYSPPMAEFITNHDNVKILVRLSLLPLVGISWLALKIGPLYTLSLLALFVFGLTLFFLNKISSNKKTI